MNGELMITGVYIPHAEGGMAQDAASIEKFVILEVASCVHNFKGFALARLSYSL